MTLKVLTYYTFGSGVVVNGGQFARSKQKVEGRLLHGGARKGVYIL